MTCVDIGNAYFEAETTEKVFAVAGAEFEELEGRVLKITKALYGLKSSGARWHDVLADALRDLGWKSCKMEPNFWYRENGDGYEFICIWVDDILIASKRNEAIHDDLKRLFKVKGGEFPSYYLGADLEFVEDPTSGEMVLGLSCRTYLKNVIPRIEEKLRDTSGETKLARTRVLTPMMEHYHPEEEVEMEVTEDKRKWYMSLVGMGSWCMQLCRIDIAYAVNSMASYRHSPSESHLSAVLRIFAYVKSRGAASIKFRTEVPDYSLLKVEDYDWIQQYGDIKEEVPYFAIQPKGPPVRMTCFVDANHARCTATRRSTTGIIHFINSTPFEWTSKKQSTVEASTYGAEFVALRLAVEQIKTNRMFLQSIGVPLDGPTWVLCDNLAVVRSVNVPEHVLKKKHLAVAYHMAREAVASGMLHIVYVPTGRNVADVCTKPLTCVVLDRLMLPVLYVEKEGSTLLKVDWVSDD